MHLCVWLMHFNFGGRESRPSKPPFPRIAQCNPHPVAFRAIDHAAISACCPGLRALLAMLSAVDNPANQVQSR